MSTLTPNARIAAYQAAYREANGGDIAVSYANGWFTIGEWPSQSKVRGHDLDDYVGRLRARQVQS